MHIALPCDCLDKGIKEAIDSSHFACQYIACHANNRCPTEQCAKQLSKCQNKRKKKYFKGSETEKKSGIEPTAELVNHCYIRGFDRNVQQLFFVYSTQRTVKNKQKQIAISNLRSRVTR